MGELLMDEEKGASSKQRTNEKGGTVNPKHDGAAAQKAGGVSALV